MRHPRRSRDDGIGGGEQQLSNNVLHCVYPLFGGFLTGFFYPLTAGMGYDDYDGLGRYWFVIVTFGLGFGHSASYRL